MANCSIAPQPPSCIDLFHLKTVQSILRRTSSLRVLEHNPLMPLRHFQKLLLSLLLVLLRRKRLGQYIHNNDQDNRYRENSKHAEAHDLQSLHEIRHHTYLLPRLLQAK